MLAAAMKKAEAEPYPVTSRRAKYRQAVSIAYHLSRTNSDHVFFFAEKIAQHFGVLPDTARGWLEQMVEEGLVVLDKKQSDGTRLCNHYRWIGPSLEELAGTPTIDDEPATPEQQARAYTLPMFEPAVMVELGSKPRWRPEWIKQADGA